jgi:hypothetical protein
MEGRKDGRKGGRKGRKKGKEKNTGNTSCMRLLQKGHGTLFYSKLF